MELTLYVHNSKATWKQSKKKKKKSSFTFSFITFPQHIDKAIMDSRYRGSKKKKKKKKN